MYFVPGFIAGLVFIPILLGFARFFGLYTCVRECEAQVFTLFGKVIGTIDTAGLQFPLSHFGVSSLLYRPNPLIKSYQDLLPTSPKGTSGKLRSDELTDSKVGHARLKSKVIT